MTISGRGFALEILLFSDRTVIHRSEHYTRDAALNVLPALGYPTNVSGTLINYNGSTEIHTLHGFDHLLVKLSRLPRDPKLTFDFLVTVRITGVRAGWNTTVLETPKFALVSNAGSGSIYDYPSVRQAVRNMFKPSMRDGDEMHVTIQPLELTGR